MTIIVTATQRLAQGQVRDISAAVGVQISKPQSGPLPTFSNAGTINVTNSSAPISGVWFDFGLAASSFTNEATGVLRVTSSSATSSVARAFGGANGITGDLNNAGLIEVTSGDGAVGVDTAKTGFVMSNTGVLRVRAGSDAVGVYSMNGGTISNGGTIDVSGATARGIQTGSAAYIANSGLIRAVSTTTDGAAVAILVDNSALTVTHIVNAGRIEARYAIVDQNAYSPVSARQRIDNTGEIVGIVDLAHGDDVLNNQGTIVGEVWLGYGADVYAGSGGLLSGAVHGGFGGDRLEGGAGADQLYGEDGDDTVRGLGGDDLLQSGRGDDLIDGGDGIDTVTYAGLTVGATVDLGAGTASAAGVDSLIGIENANGSEWRDTLRGNAFANRLFGAAGDDVLDGRAGDDELVGGAGADTLTGGEGADLFRFGVGDGNDVIKDLAVGDRLVIHGYAAWRELVQVGSDVRIVLSDTDSILLTGVSPTDVSARVSFEAAPRPDLAGSGPAPVRADAGLIEIESRFVVYEGERLVFDGDRGALSIRAWPDDSDPGSLTNAGYIRVAGTTGAMGAGTNGLGRVEFLNLASGVLEVVASGANARAIGVFGGSFNPTINNHGRIDVRSAGTADGLYSDNIDMAFNNTGTLYVEAQGRAWGAALQEYGTLHNSGSIIVIGSGDAIGVTSRRFSTIVNEGTIRVTNRTGESIGVRLTSDVIDFTNTGRIEATVALDAKGFFDFARSNYLNSGQLMGRVSLTGYEDTFVNTGLISGVVTLNEGDDLFDGTGGRQLSQVRGGIGRDTIKGGAQADNLAGDEGSDRLVGGLGNDRLEGGAGDDYAVFSGVRSAYSWTVAGDTVTVTGPDGIDVLIGMELLQFADELVSLTGFGIREIGSGGDDVVHGSSLNDVIDGGEVPHLWAIQGSTDNGVDRFFGYEGDDILTGGGNNDFLHGGIGNDTLDGGVGGDTAIFSGRRSDYSIVAANGVITITGPDGVDTLRSIERLRFSNGLFDATGAPVLDIIDGSTGNDRLQGGDYADTLNGLVGNDVLIGGTGDDAINGHSGTDTAVFSGVRSAYVITVAGGTTTVTGPDGRDVLTGVEWLQFADGRYSSAGVPDVLSLTGGEGDDTLSGEAGADVLSGMGGADVLAGRGGNDTLAGGDGSADVAVFAGLMAAYTVATSGDVTTVTGPDGTDTLTGVERLRFDDGVLLVGAGGGQYFAGSAAGDVLIGSGFNDLVEGWAGADSLDGALGADALFGGDGDDTIVGGLGDDSIDGGAGVDTAIFADAAYTVAVSGGVVTVSGPDGVDTLTHVERIRIGASTIAVGSLGAVNRLGTSAGETLAGTVAAESLFGLGGNDTLNGDGGDDILVGGAGVDVLNGGAGIDTADYSAAAAGMRAQLNSNSSSNDGDGGTDTFVSIENLTGSAYNDILIGDANGNVLRGGLGSDVLLGLAGADVLWGGAGASNTLQGGLGDDRYVLEANDSVVEVAGEGTDTIEARINAYVLALNVENLVFGGTGNFAATGNAQANTITGGAGDDNLRGRGGVDVLNGGAGIDTVDYTLAAAGVTARLDTNRATNDGDGATDTFTGVENLTGSVYNDLLIGNAGNNVLHGGIGTDTLLGFGGDDILWGGSGGGNNQLQGGTGNDYYVLDAFDTCVELAGEGIDTVEARIGSYTMGANIENLLYVGGTGTFVGTGNTLDNQITGGNGNDILRGRGGNDTINGGLGKDEIQMRGLAADYTVVADGSGWRITDSVAGRDGSTFVTSIEVIRWSNNAVRTLSYPPVAASIGEAGKNGPEVSPLMAADADHFVLPALASDEARVLPGLTAAEAFDGFDVASGLGDRLFLGLEAQLAQHDGWTTGLDHNGHGQFAHDWLV